jgi:hypothetical protein
VGAKCKFNGPNRVGRVAFHAALLAARSFYKDSVLRVGDTFHVNSFLDWIEMAAITDTDVNDLTHDTCRFIWLHALYEEFSTSIAFNDGDAIVDSLRNILDFCVALGVGTKHVLGAIVRYLRLLLMLPLGDRSADLSNLTLNRTGCAGGNEACDYMLGDLSEACEKDDQVATPK